MSDAIVNYDGSITASPRPLVYPETIEDIQSVLRDPRVIRHLFGSWEATIPSLLARLRLAPFSRSPA